MSAVTPVTRVTRRKTRAASLSILCNAVLIVIKVVAGALTGSVAILAEAVQSGIDLLASTIAWASVRKADEPADDDHRYGHEKLEDLAAAAEGMLILVGAAVLIFEGTRRLVNGGEVERLGIGIAVIAFSALSAGLVSLYLSQIARETRSPALEGDSAHLRTDAWTSLGVLGGLVLVQVTGADWLDAAVGLAVAAAIVVAGLRLLSRSSRVLVDQSLPGDEVEVIRMQVLAFGPRGVAGFHQLRTRRAGARRHVDLHVQFRSGTTLEDAHATAHELQDAIRSRLDGADVLIHLEPEDRVRPGTEVPPAAGRG